MLRRTARSPTSQPISARVADAIARATKAVAPELALLAISGTELEPAGRAAGLQVFSEIFADRGYLANGRLMPRSRRPGAMIEDPEAAAGRLIQYLETGLMPTFDGSDIRLEAHSICVHGDSPHAVKMARVIREKLTGKGVEIRPFLGRA